MASFAITAYPDDAKITEQLNALIKMPAYGIKKDVLAAYERDYYDTKCATSKEMAEAAAQRIPGGVQHNLAFHHPFPVVFTKAEDAYLYDIDGNRYYDFLQAGGTTILGSNPPAVREKVIELLNTCGPATGLVHEYEYKLADKVCELFPSVEMFRMLGSGTEACMAAIRVARIATGKKNILRMGGAYHGWSDQLAYGIRIPGSRHIPAQGIPKSCFEGMKEFYPNDLSDLESKLRAGSAAAVILEPLGPESGTRPLAQNYCKEVEALCVKYGALLIFDESVTAFRIGMSGAQGYFDVAPDLTVFGKTLTGGYPGSGGIGGKSEYMKHLAAGIQAGEKVKKALVGGTLAAAPISCVAGYHTLCELERTDAPAKAGALGDRLTKGLQEIIGKYSLPFVAFNQGSICHLETLGTLQFSINWGKPWQIPEVPRQTGLRKKKMEHFGAAYMAEGLVTVAGSRLFTSAAHTDEMIDEALAAFDRVLQNAAVSV